MEKQILDQLKVCRAKLANYFANHMTFGNIDWTVLCLQMQLIRSLNSTFIIKYDTVTFVRIKSQGE